jgi:hypothetical protein
VGAGLTDGPERVPAGRGRGSFHFPQLIRERDFPGGFSAVWKASPCSGCAPIELRLGAECRAPGSRRGHRQGLLPADPHDSLLVITQDGGGIEAATIGYEGAVRVLGKRRAFTRAAFNYPAPSPTFLPTPSSGRPQRAKAPRTSSPIIPRCVGWRRSRCNYSPRVGWSRAGCLECGRMLIGSRTVRTALSWSYTHHRGVLAVASAPARSYGRTSRDLKKRQLRHVDRFKPALFYPLDVH